MEKTTQTTIDMRLVDAAMRKEFTEWTDEERDAMLAYDAEQERIRKEREEKERRLRAEADERLRVYNETLRQQEQRDRKRAELRTTNPVAYFMDVSQRQAQAPLRTLRLDMSQPQARELVEAAYRKQVARDGRQTVAEPQLNGVFDIVSRWLASDRRKQGLILTGNVGCGKTTMLYALADVARVMTGETVAIVEARKVGKIMKENGKQFAELAKERLLAVDDLGTEPQTVKDYGNDLTPMLELLTERYERRLPVLATTNLTREGLAQQYGQRMEDRLFQMCNWIEYAAYESFRKR